ncbi:V-type sodium pump subunit D [Limihaloglobus sulfuriphilus]|uniref:V-type ATP synthase subunit D n=1 Tax=Limihaloglobus sulfuriphilus TaxID=1851148 RepID=A0A1Q2MAI4_9BACT|nr:V-type ATP synthase subunit D [Limihaloglobus sulfuriphilus]AQQ69735.1 V-type sodium pump subunit D [Limihaloglobus sulfuriphilus]
MAENVTATRMELLNLRKKGSLARRGHKLLSQKRDELSRRLVEISRNIGKLRKEVEQEILRTSRKFMMARATVEPEDMKAALSVPTKRFSLAVNFASVMNVKVPEMAKELEGDIICYGMGNTSGELDMALRALERTFDRLIELAAKEKQARLLATELQSTRRRVNVLEHVVIPETDETIRLINNKLSEVERDNISRLMKIADIIRA